MKYLSLLRNPKYLVLLLVLLVHPLFRPRWVDAIDRGLMRLFRGKPYRPFQQKTTVTWRVRAERFAQESEDFLKSRSSDA